MTDDGRRRIAALLQASGLEGKHLDSEWVDNDDECTVYDVAKLETIAVCYRPAIAEFYAAAPSAVAALLAELAELRATLAIREKHMNPHVLKALQEGRLRG